MQGQGLLSVGCYIALCIMPDMLGLRAIIFTAMIKVIFFEFEHDEIPKSVIVDSINIEQAKSVIISIYPDAIIKTCELIV